MAFEGNSRKLPVSPFLPGILKIRKTSSVRKSGYNKFTIIMISFIAFKNEKDFETSVNNIITDLLLKF